MFGPWFLRVWSVVFVSAFMMTVVLSEGTILLRRITAAAAHTSGFNCPVLRTWRRSSQPICSCSEALASLAILWPGSDHSKALYLGDQAAQPGCISLILGRVLRRVWRQLVPEILPYTLQRDSRSKGGCSIHEGFSSQPAGSPPTPMPSIGVLHFPPPCASLWQRTLHDSLALMLQNYRTLFMLHAFWVSLPLGCVGFMAWTQTPAPPRHLCRCCSKGIRRSGASIQHVATNHVMKGLWLCNTLEEDLWTRSETNKTGGTCSMM